MYFQTDFFLEFIPVILLILIINFYIIHQHNRKIILYLLNGLIFLIPVYFLSIGKIGNKKIPPKGRIYM